MPAPHPKTVVVTGAVTGLGASLALQLADVGWRLVLLNRNRAKTEPLLAQLSRTRPSTAVDMIEVDLSDHREVPASLHDSAHS
jgi:short-subunit dehydrogenase